MRMFKKNTEIRIQDGSELDLHQKKLRIFMSVHNFRAPVIKEDASLV